MSLNTPLWMPGLLQKPLFQGLFKNGVPISLFLPPSFFPPTSPHHPPVKSWHPESTPFKPEIPEPAVVPWQKRPSAEPWANVCRHAVPPPLLVSLTKRNHFLLPPKKTRLHPKVSHKLKKTKNWQPLHRRAHKSCSSTRDEEAATDPGKTPEKWKCLGPPRPIT